MTTYERRATIARAATIGVMSTLLFSAAMPLSAADGISESARQQRQTYLGPEEGETLTSWTERWFEGPVQFIATAEEKEIYGRLESTTQRLQFIRLFWERRDPTLRGPDNEFVDEFVRRVEYANEEFSDGQEGWKTVFGQVALTLGPPSRTDRQLGFPSTVSQRPVILWIYDRRIPEYPVNEALMFVFQRGRWRLAPPSDLTEPPSAVTAGRQMERLARLSEIPNDFLRTMQTVTQDSLVQSVRYDDVVNNIEAEVAFPDAEIPFAWTAEFGAASAGNVDVALTLSWRMEALIFHVVGEEFTTEMVIYAVLLDDDGEPVAEASEPVRFTVAVDELEERGDEIVEKTVPLSAPPGTYRMTLSLDDHLMGYRSVYRDDLVVPSR